MQQLIANEILLQDKTKVKKKGKKQKKVVVVGGGGMQ
jgi:hypothetical protein